MTTTRPASAPSTAPDRSVLRDLLALTPSSTLGRELFALVANLAIVGLLVTVIRPEAIAAGVMLAVVGLFMIGRLVAGFATRGYAAALRGER